MIIMADSTCLIGLARINKLEILKSLFGEIHIPEAVYREIVEKGEGRAGAFEIEQANWIMRHK